MSHRTHIVNLDDMLVWVGRFDDIAEELDLDTEDCTISSDAMVLVLSDPGNQEHWLLPTGGDEPVDAADLVADLVIRILQTQRITQGVL